MKEFATVSDVLSIMAQLEAEGFGEYIVTCNGEYYLARKEDIPEINEAKETIDLGGYD